jgi:hypothetical protein
MIVMLHIMLSLTTENKTQEAVNAATFYNQNEMKARWHMQERRKKSSKQTTEQSQRWDDIKYEMQ